MLVFMAVIRFFQFFHLHPQKKKSVAHSSLLNKSSPTGFEACEDENLHSRGPQCHRLSQTAIRKGLC